MVLSDSDPLGERNSLWLMMLGAGLFCAASLVACTVAHCVNDGCPYTVRTRCGCAIRPFAPRGKHGAC